MVSSMYAHALHVARDSRVVSVFTIVVDMDFKLHWNIYIRTKSLPRPGA